MALYQAPAESSITLRLIAETIGEHKTYRRDPQFFGTAAVVEKAQEAQQHTGQRLKASFTN
ncbi:hypothetical protein KID98_08390 [Pseudomonas syringae]|uniref:hypothetical protein n=1 Tax=Pseudomonas syringae TaxID=317 RepID=UPI00040FDB23|nr:hypothetical protein [Pseudomonas syringae]MBS7435792.1 hypothetical protein [Pseudomonas syringae]MBS7460713.1 hypothetical protein [Pseudomonas syringae]MBS7470845.1 hypothetical protein [Pseudomonas syringae]QVI70628.1 hypothetical protein KHW12_00300 [Pseudomonas syringae]